MLNYIDLFAGAGGLSEGFTATGFHPISHIEMNAEACKTLKTRACYYYLKEVDRLNIYQDYLKGNITRDELYSIVPKYITNTVINQTMSESTMPELFQRINKLLDEQKINKVDLIVGGPPCQAYSLVGRAVKSDGMANDPRNHLYKLYVKVLEEYQPKMFVFENVPGLLTANKGQYLRDMETAFNGVGYEIKYKVLNSADFGVLQNRHRVILIGWKKGSTYFYPEFAVIKNNYLVRDILDDLPSIQSGEECHEYREGNYSTYLSENEIRKIDDILTWHVARPNIERDRSIYRQVINTWNQEKKRTKYTDLPDDLCTHKNREAFLDRFKVVAADLPASHTMMAHISKDGHYFIHPDINQARSISVREAARIQSFPDDFYFEGARTAAFTQIGNAVPPMMAKGIAQELKKQLEEK
jgi:DNA (cytosine-5)-methyltransferase 1